MTFFAMFLLVQAAEEPHRLPIQVSTPEKSVQSVIHLQDETGIAHLVTAFGKEDVSVEVKHNKVFVKLLKAVEGSLDLIGTSGRLYRVQLTLSERTLPQLALRAPAVRAPVVAGEVPLPLRLIRAMRLGEELEGASISRSTAVLVDEGGIVIQLQWVYRLDDLAGYVCTVRNRTRNDVRLDPSQFRSPGLAVVGVRDLKLGPGEVTRLYWIAEEGDE
jgi:hypothetical protein